MGDLCQIADVLFDNNVIFAQAVRKAVDFNDGLRHLELVVNQFEFPDDVFASETHKKRGICGAGSPANAS